MLLEIPPTLVSQSYRVGHIESAGDQCPGFVIWARAGLALIAAHQGDTARAEEHYDTLKSARGTWAPGSLMVMDHVLGLISATMVQLDQAVVHFEDVLTLYQIAGYRPELA